MPKVHELLLLGLAIGAAIICFLALVGRLKWRNGEEEEETISEIMRGGG